MTRKFLAGLGIAEDETITKILNAHQETVQPLKDDLDKIKGDLKAASGGKDWKAEYETEAQAHAATKAAVADYDTIKQMLESEKKAHEAEKDAHKTTRDGYTAEKDAAETTALIRKSLTDNGANPKAVDLLLKAVDPTLVKKKDGAISNWEDVYKPIKEQYADFFGTVEQKGADIGTPPSAKSGEADPFLAGFDS